MENLEDFHKKKVQVYENGTEELLQVLDTSGNDCYSNLHKKVRAKV